MVYFSFVCGWFNSFCLGLAFIYMLGQLYRIEYSPMPYLYVYRRFHGRCRHLVGRAKNSDRLGRVILFRKNGGRIEHTHLFSHLTNSHFLRYLVTKELP